MIGTAAMEVCLKSIYKYIIGFKERIEYKISNTIPETTNVVEKGNNKVIISESLYSYTTTDIPVKLACWGSYNKRTTKSIIIEENDNGEIEFSTSLIMAGSSLLMDNYGLINLRVFMRPGVRLPKANLNKYTTEIEVAPNKYCYITFFSDKFSINNTTLTIRYKVSNETIQIFMVSYENDSNLYKYENHEFYGIYFENKKGIIYCCRNDSDADRYGTYTNFDKYIDNLQLQPEKGLSTFDTFRHSNDEIFKYNYDYFYSLINTDYTTIEINSES